MDETTQSAAPADDMAAAIAAGMETAPEPQPTEATPGEREAASEAATPVAQAPSEPQAPQTADWAMVNKLDRERRELRQQLKELQQRPTVDTLKERPVDERLAAVGLSLQSILDHYAGATETPPAAPQAAKAAVPPELQAELKALRDQVEQLRQPIEAQRQREYQQLYDAVADAITDAAFSTPEAEYFQAFLPEAQAEAVKLSALYWQETQRELPPRDAALAIEAELRKSPRHVAQFRRISELRSKAAPQAAIPAAKPTAASPTLGGSSAPTPAPRETASDAELLEMAIRAGMQA